MFEFQFVSIDGGQPLSRKEQKRVRSFVMRQHNTPTENQYQSTPSSKMTNNISSYKSRFRISKHQKPAIDQGTNGDYLDHQQPPNSIFSQKQESPISDDLSNPEDFEQRTFGLELDTSNPFHSFPLVLRDSLTLQLLEYYHYSFWANSYACNPEKSWMPLAMTDSAMLHATLTLVAIHRRDCCSALLDESYFKHRGQAMKLIVERLHDSTAGISESTIGAVAILSNSDNQFDWSTTTQAYHIDGLYALVHLRGGIESLKANKDIQRVVAWADLLHAASKLERPRLPLPSYLFTSSSGDIIESTPPYKSPEPTSDIIEDLPVHLRRAIQRLRSLFEIKCLLVECRTSELCQKFSRLLWKFEHDILEAIGSPDEVKKIDTYNCNEIQDSLFKATGVASLILTFSGLRDLAASVIFSKLSRHLKGHIERLKDTVWLENERVKAPPRYQHSGHRVPRSQIVLLLWIMFQGWKACCEDPAYQEWFSQKAAQLCMSNSILSETSFCTILQNIIPRELDLEMESSKFWADISIKCLNQTFHHRD